MLCDLCKEEVTGAEWFNGYWICDDDAFRIHHPEELTEDFELQHRMGYLNEHEVKVLTDIGVLEG